MANELPMSPLQQEYTDQALLDMQSLFGRNPYVDCFKSADQHYYKLCQGKHRPRKKEDQVNDDVGGEEEHDPTPNHDDTFTLSDEKEASITNWITKVQDVIPSCFNYKRKYLTIVGSLSCNSLVRPLK